jgi:nucleotide-binding universal stress UspA family protein
MEKILVPVDGSSFSEAAVKKAIEIAREKKAEVTLLHILQRPNPEVETDKFFAESLSQKGQGILSESQNAFENVGVDVGTEMRCGDPAAEILRMAEEGKYTLIIMGPKGLSEIPELAIGGVTQKVVAHAPCPVLVVRS